MDEKEKDAMQHPQESRAKIENIFDLHKSLEEDVKALNTEIDKDLKDFSLDIGTINIKSVNKVIEEAKRTPNPVPLFLSLWYENEICFLFSDTNLGKTILAIQVAEQIARKNKNKRVLYFDFEMSDKQFQKRYTNETCTYDFAPNLFRATFSRENYENQTEEQLVQTIEDAVKDSLSGVVIIDNITYLCSNLEKGSEAGSLMKKLKIMAIQNEWSLLVVAHTPKNPPFNPISIDNMAGSKNLVNFADSVFTIGRCRKDENLRYIKQLKTRAGEFKYGSENVLICTLEKGENGFIHFNIIGNDSEKNVLECSDADKDRLKQRVLDLNSQGYSIREIAKEVGVSKSSVERMINTKKQ